MLPPSVSARVAVEQASTFGWERYVGTTGRIIGMNTFGASAPLKELQKKFGFDPDGFALVSEAAVFTLAGGGRRVTVELLSGYSFAQVFAPAGKEFVALEPMTAPTSALTTGQSLRLAGPGESFSAVFRIRVEDAP